MKNLTFSKCLKIERIVTADVDVTLKAGLLEPKNNTSRCNVICQWNDNRLDKHSPRQRGGDSRSRVYPSTVAGLVNIWPMAERAGRLLSIGRGNVLSWSRSATFVPFVSNGRVTSESADFTDLQVGPKSDQLIPANIFFQSHAPRTLAQPKWFVLFLNLTRNHFLISRNFIVGAHSIG